VNFLPRSLFGTFALLVLFLMHFYAWRRLVLAPRLPRAWRMLLTAVLAALFVALPACFAIMRGTPLAERLALTLVAFVWLGVLFYVVLMLAAVDLARLGAWAWSLARRKRPGPTSSPACAAPADGVPAEAPGLSRRELLQRATAGAVALGAGTTAVAGWRGSGDITVPQVPVRLARLPRTLDGLHVVQLTDVHMGMLVDGRFLRDVVERCNSLRPDLVVITGDLVDAHVDVLGPELAALADLRSRWGTLFVTGNHEYYSGAEEWVEYLRANGVRVLLNERVAITDGGLVADARGPGLDIAGVTDFRGGRGLPEHRPDLPRALAGRDPDRELLLLAHQPRHVHEAAEHGVGLQLSGHTHGGQLWPFGALVHLVQPYVEGLHTHGERTQIYVSRGTGFWGPPMRVAEPAEITSLILHV
jgi:uncharacterized protein